MKEKFPRLRGALRRLRAGWHRLAPRPLGTKARWSLTVGLLLLATLALCCACLLLGTIDFSQKRIDFYLSDGCILALNALPVFVLVVLLYALTNRAWAAFLLSAVPLLLLLYINYFKIVLRSEPFVADDLSAVGEGAGIMGNYKIVPPTSMYLCIAGVIVLTVLLARYGRGRVPKRVWYVRPLGAALVLCLGLFAWNRYYTDDDLYSSTQIAGNNIGAFSYWRDEEAFCTPGYLWSFLHSVSDLMPEKPENYSDEAARKLLSEPDEPIPQEQRVDVITIMLESYSDLSIYDGLEFTRDAYADLHALQSESYHGTLLTDSIGGGTINAERSYLTGFTYAQPAYRRDTSSFVRYFSANGYVTTGSHPGVGWFYSRDSINRRLGFDSYLFQENYYADLHLTSDQLYRGYASYANDDTFFADILRRYDLRDTSVPYFSFNISFQGHSPYPDDRLTGDVWLSGQGVSSEAYYTVNNYLTSVASTGKELAEFVDALRQREEPVVLLVFGDHKPSLGAGGAYLEEFGLSVPSERTRFFLYETPYLIWANDAAKETLGQSFSGEGRVISPCYLMSELFDCCGWIGPSWIRLQRTLKESLPVLQMHKFFLKDGLLVSRQEGDAALNAYEIAEYYLRRHLVTYRFD